MILTGKTFLVLGSGKTGRSVAAFFDRMGVDYRLIDENAVQIFPPPADRKNRKALDFEGCYCAVTSPHYTNKWVLYEVERHRIPVISDVELFSRLSRSPILAVTGTNGKSTTVSLLADMLARRGGKARTEGAEGEKRTAQGDFSENGTEGRAKTLLLGNIGVPCLDYIEETSPEVPAVLELSSFQLERTELFCPHVAAILNLTPDHLDFHKTYEAYKSAKYRIFKNQGKTEYLVLNADETLPAPENTNILYFSTERVVDGAYLRDGALCFRGERVAEASELKLEGKHNLSNALCALAMAKCYGLDNESIAESLREFGGIEHRLERVGEMGGKLWINDSKATNIASCAVAVNTFEGKGKICLIAGGRSVENFDSFVLQAARKCARVIAFGESAARIEESCKKFGYTEIALADSLRDAVRAAAEGDCEIVLFSPACKSFDGYANFEERGADFKTAVASL